MKPDFIVIGAMKCATSTVCAYLEDHEDVFMVQGEPNYFSRDDRWALGEEWYLEHFRGAEGYRAAGEGSNGYSNLARHPETVTRMAGFRPDLKIVYMVRDPIARIRSDYIQRRTDSGDDYPSTIDEAIRAHPEIFIDQSLYWRTLSAYRAAFGDARIFVGFMEDLSRDHDAFFRGLTAFLGVEHAPVQRGHANPSVSKRVPSRSYSLVNGVPGIALAKKLVPEAVRTAVKTRFLSRPSGEVRLRPETLDHVTAALGEDPARLLAYCGRPADFWTRPARGRP